MKNLYLRGWFDIMGRKRVARGKTREPITISLPRDLIISLDATIPKEHTRSRLVESLIKNHLRVNTTLDVYSRHVYGCLDCNREFHLNKHVDPIVLICRKENAGCGSVNLVYLGVLEEEE